MAYLISLDKKLLTIQHRFTKKELDDLMVKHGLTEAQLLQELQKELYNKFLGGIAKNIPTLIQTADDKVSYTVSGYVLNQRDIFNLIKEICELDDVARHKFLEEVNQQLR